MAQLPRFYTEQRGTDPRSSDPFTAAGLSYEEVDSVKEAIHVVLTKLGTVEPLRTGFMFTMPDLSAPAVRPQLLWHGLKIGLEEGNWAPTAGQFSAASVILHYVALDADPDDEAGWSNDGRATAGCEPYPLVLPSPVQLYKMSVGRGRPCRRCSSMYMNGNWKFTRAIHENAFPAEETAMPMTPSRSNDAVTKAYVDASMGRVALPVEMHYITSADGTPIPVSEHVTGVDPKVALDGLMAQKLRIDEQIAKMAARPDEPDYGDDGTSPIVVFDKTFGGGATWTYVAVKVSAGYWMCTGNKQSNKTYTWNGLLDLAEQGEESLPAIYLVTDWTVL